MLSHRQFNRELTRERIRASRRSIPFCLIEVTLVGRTQLNKRRRKLVRLLHRNLRLTDQKGELARTKFGILLVDTPEMGGRACLDRLASLMDRAELKTSLKMRVHDPEGFDPDDFPPPNDRRRDDQSRGPWVRESSEDGELVSDHSLSPLPTETVSMKRIVDVAGAGLGLVATGPIILTAMAAIKLSSPGPALFRQTREGQNGRPFTIYKMRTMVVDAENQQAELRVKSHRDGPAFKIERDPRVTKVGHWLRKTCIDELPQLINVLRGDMSLVGPRPLPWNESRACSSWHRRRLDVRPGMTCDWQVNKAAAETFDDWMRMDLRYIDEADLIRDFRLIAQTVTVPIMGRGSQ
ncbi:MAG: sugar transferase [Planctomycetota bacterium]